VAVDVYRRTREDDASLAELALYHAIMDYRASLGLAPIPLSRGLTTTAGRHVADTRGNVWAEGDDQPPGGLHGWSDARYDPADPAAMREAPARLGTGYPGEGHEISAYGYADGDAALAAWQRSPGHDALLAERGGWADPGFAAIGVGLQTAPGPGRYGGRVFHVWFGEAADPNGPPLIRGTSAGERIAATRFADRVAGGGGDDHVLGRAGPDLLQGGAGGDRLFGGWGNDRLVGDGGGDRLVGGAGRDLLKGGTGADTFVFREAGPGRDRIADFTPGRDRVSLAAMDADLSRRGDQAFRPADDGFDGRAGALRFAEGVLAGDRDGDRRADFAIALGREPGADDLLL
jgi:hypothetical protein